MGDVKGEAKWVRLRLLGLDEQYHREHPEPEPSPYFPPGCQPLVLSGLDPKTGGSLVCGRAAKIDAEDEELVCSFSPWYRELPTRGGYYDWRSHTEVACYHPPQENVVSWSGRLPYLYLHDLVMGAGRDQEVFPANGDGLDYRKSNLRVRPKKNPTT